MKAVLALADGSVFEGGAFGAEGEAVGEVVFNTSMTGYQEILTDPSYEGQLVAMTYPQIGNTGVNTEDVESRKPFVRGFIVKDYTPSPSNWRATQPLHEYMAANHIVGVQGIDTRSLVRHLRDHGAQEGIIASGDVNLDELIAKAKASPGLIGKDLVRNVTCAEAYDWHQGMWQLAGGYKERDGTKAAKRRARGSFATPGFFVVAYDFGIKFNILRNLAEAGCQVRVVPASMPAEEVLALNSDGIFL